MPPEPEAGGASHWLEFARSDLALAQGPRPTGVMREMLCSHAQQAAEKALKALLIANDVPIVRPHNLRLLIDIVGEPHSVPENVQAAAALSDYAAITRYPGDTEPVDEDEYQTALQLAESVVNWAATILADHDTQNHPDNNPD